MNSRILKENRLLYENNPQVAPAQIAETNELTANRQEFFDRNLDSLANLPHFESQDGMDESNGLPYSEDYFLTWYICNQLIGWPDKSSSVNQSQFFKTVEELRDEDVFGEESLLGFEVKPLLEEETIEVDTGKMTRNEMGRSVRQVKTQLIKKDYGRLRFLSAGDDSKSTISDFKASLEANFDNEEFLDDNFSLHDGLTNPAIEDVKSLKQARLNHLVELIEQGQKLYSEFKANCNSYEQYQEGMRNAYENRRKVEIRAVQKQAIADRFKIATEAEKDKFRFMRSALSGTIQPELEADEALADGFVPNEMREAFFEFHQLTIEHPIDPPSSNIMLAWIAFRSNPEFIRKQLLAANLSDGQRLDSDWIAENFFSYDVVYENKIPGFYYYDGDWFLTYYSAQTALEASVIKIHNPVLTPELAFEDILKYSSFNADRTLLSPEQIFALEKYLEEAREIAPALGLINDIVYQTRGELEDLIPEVIAAPRRNFDVADLEEQKKLIENRGFIFASAELSENKDFVLVNFLDPAEQLRYEYEYHNDGQQTILVYDKLNNELVNRAVSSEGGFGELIPERASQALPPADLMPLEEERAKQIAEYSDETTLENFASLGEFINYLNKVSLDDLKSANAEDLAVWVEEACQTDNDEVLDALDSNDVENTLPEVYREAYDSTSKTFDLKKYLSILIPRALYQSGLNRATNKVTVARIVRDKTYNSLHRNITADMGDLDHNEDSNGRSQLTEQTPAGPYQPSEEEKNLAKSLSKFTGIDDLQDPKKTSSILGDFNSLVNDTDILKDVFISGDTTALDALMAADPEFANSTAGAIISCIAIIAPYLKYLFKYVGVKEGGYLSQFISIDREGVEKRLFRSNPPKTIGVAKLNESMTIDFSEEPYLSHIDSLKGSIACPLEETGTPPNTTKVVKERIELQSRTKGEPPESLPSADEDKFNKTSSVGMPPFAKRFENGKYLVMTLPAGTVLTDWEIKTS